MSRAKASLDHKRIQRLIWLVLTVFVLLGYSLQSVAGSVYYSMVMRAYGTVSSPPVILEEGNCSGTTTIYTNKTSAKVSVGAPPVWLSGWDERVKITIDHNDIDSDLSNFPVLICLSSSSGRDNDDVTFVFDEVGSNSKKIAVTTSNGTTQCYVEIEKWDNASEQAWLWVKVPSISNTSDTDLYLYYDNDHADNTDYVDDTNTGNSVNVWDSNFKMVQHLHETSGIHYDSTSNNWDSTSVTVTQQGADIGKIDGADEFNGTSDYVAIGDLDQTGDFAVECWMKADVITGGWRSLVMKTFDYGFEFNDPGVLWVSFNDSSGWGARISYDGIVVGQHYHVVMVWDEINNDLYLYVNGTLVDSDLTMGDHVTNDLDLLFGSWDGTSQYFDGVVDEVRISNTTRSVAWIKASYESGRDHLLNFGPGDYVDNNTSDVDSSPDKGTHSNFTTQKYFDGIYDTLTEVDKSASGDNNVDSEIVTLGSTTGISGAQTVDGITENMTEGIGGAPTYVDSTEASVGSGTSITIPAPSGIQDDDLMIMSVVSSDPATLTPPSGWTQRFDFDYPSTTSTPHHTVWTKVASSESGDYTVTSSASVTLIGHIAVYRGANATPHKLGGPNTGTSLDPTSARAR